MYRYILCICKIIPASDANAVPHRSNRVRTHEQVVGDIWQILVMKDRSIAESTFRMAQEFDVYTGRAYDYPLESFLSKTKCCFLCMKPYGIH